jgi:hypothetical protein
VLDESQIEYALIEAGNIWLVAPDSERVRQVLFGINKLAKHSVSEEVLVPEVGFVAAGIKKRLEIRNLLGPVIVALLSMGLFIVPTLIPEQEALEQPKQVEISCVLDLPADEFNKWVAESFEGRGTSNAAEVQVQSELGTLTLEVQQTLGSTQSVTGQAECEDGRSKKLHYRLDTSANGNLVEIGQELNP